MTPKQYIKYVRWLKKNNLAICDGSTMEPLSLFEILQNIFIVAGLGGLGYYAIHKFSEWLEK